MVVVIIHMVVAVVHLVVVVACNRGSCMWYSGLLHVVVVVVA